MLVLLKPKLIISGAYVADWCKMPYNGKDGCPNVGKPDCPPNTRIYSEIIDPPYYLVIREFNIGEYTRQQMEKHPDRSEKQCRVSYLWQSKQDNLLKSEAMEHIVRLQFWEADVVMRPEKYYVNLFSTCRLHGIELKKNPQDIIKLICMIGRGRGRLEDIFG